MATSETLAVANTQARPLRIRWVDVAKGIGIILVSFGHLRNGDGQSVWLPALDPLISAIYLFHMPLFFFLAGVTFNNRRSFGEFVARKAKTLLVPYYLFSLYFLAKPIACLLIPSLAATFQSAHDYSIALQFFDVLVMGNGLWFLMALFIAECFVYPMSKVLNGNPLKCTVAGVAMILLYRILQALGIDVIVPFKLVRALEVSGFMCWGIALKKLVDALGSKSIWLGTALSLVMTIVLSYFALTGQVFIIKEGASILTALTGTSLCVLVSKICEHNSSLAYIGKCSLVFYAVNALCLNVAKLGMFRVLHSNLMNSNFAMQFVGGAVCTVLAMGFMQLANVIVRRWLPWTIGISREQQ